MKFFSRKGALSRCGEVYFLELLSVGRVSEMYGRFVNVVGYGAAIYGTGFVEYDCVIKKKENTVI